MASRLADALADGRDSAAGLSSLSEEAGEGFGTELGLVDLPSNTEAGPGEEEVSLDDVRGPRMVVAGSDSDISDDARLLGSSNGVGGSSSVSRWSPRRLDEAGISDHSTCARLVCTQPWRCTGLIFVFCTGLVCLVLLVAMLGDDFAEWESRSATTCRVIGIEAYEIVVSFAFVPDGGEEPETYMVVVNLAEQENGATRKTFVEERFFDQEGLGFDLVCFYNVHDPGKDVVFEAPTFLRTATFGSGALAVVFLPIVLMWSRYYVTHMRPSRGGPEAYHRWLVGLHVSSSHQYALTQRVMVVVIPLLLVAASLGFGADPEGDPRVIDLGNQTALLLFVQLGTMWILVLATSKASVFGWRTRWRAGRLVSLVLDTEADLAPAGDVASIGFVVAPDGVVSRVRALDVFPGQREEMEDPAWEESKMILTVEASTLITSWESGAVVAVAGPMLRISAPMLFGAMWLLDLRSFPGAPDPMLNLSRSVAVAFVVLAIASMVEFAQAIRRTRTLARSSAKEDHGLRSLEEMGANQRKAFVASLLIVPPRLPIAQRCLLWAVRINFALFFIVAFLVHTEWHFVANGLWLATGPLVTLIASEVVFSLGPSGRPSVSTGEENTIVRGTRTHVRVSRWLAGFASLLVVASLVVQVTNYLAWGHVLLGHSAWQTLGLNFFSALLAFLVVQQAIRPRFVNRNSL